MKHFQGRNVFLTGAASGIGRALAVRLAERGSRLFLVDRDGAGLADVQRQLQGGGATVWVHQCDLCDPAEVSGATHRALELTGGIDLLINNAGVAYYGPTMQMTQQQWDWVLSVNLLAPIQISRELLPSLLSRPDTHVVNMCSISGLVAGGRFAAYHTSKFGLVGLTAALRAEFGRRGLGVTAICPGPVLTRLYASIASGHADQKVPEPPRWLSTTPERVAEITLRSIRRNRAQVLITPMAHGLFFLQRFLPWLIDFANQFSKSKRRRQQKLRLSSRSGTL